MHPQRRILLKVLCTSPATWLPGGLVTACGDATGTAEPRGPIPAGNVEDLQPGEPRTLDEPVVVILDDRGVYAMSTVCTHQQCDIRRTGSISSSGLRCSCHGSTFTLTGQVVSGPARSSLRHLAVEIDDGGELVVQADRVVDPDERLEVMAGG